MGEICPIDSGSAARDLTTPDHPQSAQVADITTFTSGTRAAFRTDQSASRSSRRELRKCRKEMLMTQFRITVVTVLVGAYLLGFGMLAGVVVDRMLFDKQRSKVLGRYERALKDWHSFRMTLEKDATERRAHSDP
jgi:hypothetical protein